MPGAFYLDVGGSYKLNSQVSAYFRVDNLLDKDPVAAPSTGVSPGVNSLLYDVLGRTFRLGVRTTF